MSRSNEVAQKEHIIAGNPAETFVGAVTEANPRQKSQRDRKHTKAERMPRSKPKPTGLEYNLADLFLTQPDLQIFSHPQSGGGGDASTPRPAAGRSRDQFRSHPIDYHDNHRKCPTARETHPFISITWHVRSLTVAVQQNPFGQATCRSASGITTWQDVLSIVKCGLESPGRTNGGTNAEYRDCPRHQPTFDVHRRRSRVPSGHQPRLGLRNGSTGGPTRIALGTTATSRPCREPRGVASGSGKAPHAAKSGLDVGLRTLS